MTPSHLLRLDVGGHGGRLTSGLVSQLHLALSQPGEARVLMLHSSAPVFCEGLDLERLGVVDEDAGVAAFGDLLEALRRDARPVIAVIDGAAKGGGVGLAAVADGVIASDRATFALPETLLGLIPAVVFPHLAARVGPSGARWLALGGVAWSATEAQARGLVDELTPTPLATAERRALRLSRMDPRAQAAMKRLVADHLGWSPLYRDDAVRTFRELLASPTTKGRIARLASGHAPWDEDPDV